MAMNLDERIAKSKAHTAKLEQLRRAEQRKKREAEKKKSQHRNLIIGEMVSNHFPEVTKLEPGTKEENLATFKPLESFLSVLSADKELVKQLKEISISHTPLDSKK